MPLWIRDGIEIPGGSLITPLISYNVRRWSFPGPVLPPRGPSIDDIYPNNNGKTMVVATGPTNSILQGPHHRHLALKVVTVAEPTGNTPQGAHHRRLLTNSMVAAAGPTNSTPKSPAIDVFYNFGGGHYQTHRQHPPRGPPSMSPYNFGGGRCQTHQQHPSRGPPSTSSTTLVVAAAEPGNNSP
jgi:hypothetical protein